MGLIGHIWKGLKFPLIIYSIEPNNMNNAIAYCLIYIDIQCRVAKCITVHLKTYYVICNK